MKFIKLQIQLIVVLSIGLISCSSQKSLQKDVPFEMGVATLQHWMGGKEDSGTGILVNVPVSKISEEVLFQKIYFRGQTALVTIERDDDGLMVQGNFPNTPTKPDLIMHADPKMEVGNQPPPIPSGSVPDFPFELGLSEAVLSYSLKNNIKYVKITALKENSPLIYSTKPKN